MERDKKDQIMKKKGIEFILKTKEEKFQSFIFILYNHLFVFFSRTYHCLNVSFKHSVCIILTNNILF